MKPETKRTRRRSDEEGGGASAFNLGSMKKAIEAIDVGRKENTINLSSLSVALSAASREMKKQTVKSERKRVRETRVGKTKKKEKKLAIGTKPKTKAKLRRWLSNLDESVKVLSSSSSSVQQTRLSLQLQHCELNTDFTMNHCLESFR
ncbi:hypothetical protein CARUB_v10012511mg [Capsella rubella]|uniref:Uncharacterized protein n=1 Tax=Capsella rubella TaxID=81985 RepID=R0I1N2_9BRAS|nr:uncharacterized protein LOC17899430 [Capsella rubella]EOA36134.1 hypothetical protein CARUB_v10012511mg [Capsella rubella]